jgi:hypothetical protein
MSKATRVARREAVRRHMEELGYAYADTARNAASFLSDAAEFVGAALLALFWSALGAVALGLLLGPSGTILGFAVVLVGVVWPSFGAFVLTFALAAIPGALMAAPLCLVFGGAFVAWWLVATVGVVLVVWARSVAEPAAAPPRSIPSLHGIAAPAHAQELDDLEFLE